MCSGEKHSARGETEAAGYKGRMLSLKIGYAGEVFLRGRQVNKNTRLMKA